MSTGQPGTAAAQALRLVTAQNAAPACAVQDLIRSGADDVKSKALQTAGNLAFCPENRALLRKAEGFREIVLRLADDSAAMVKHEVRMSAIRALAILGESLNE